jgi:hypothetical protein
MSLEEGNLRAVSAAVTNRGLMAMSEDGESGHHDGSAADPEDHGDQRRITEKGQGEARQHQHDVQDREQHQLAERVECPSVRSHILRNGLRVMNGIDHGSVSPAGGKTPAISRGCAPKRKQYLAAMKSVSTALIALLVVALPAVAQSSLEDDLRTAAAAYERKDPSTAVRLWKIWADKGNAEARTLLGAMHWSGEGVPRDHKEAARLYLLAANQGYARAQNDIGFMLGFGEGIPPRDDVEAYKWLTLATQRYTSKNEDRLEQVKRDLATLSKRMSRAQIADAESRAMAWKPLP